MITLNILVIGNGFDLAHGLPTTYMDFLIFLDLMKYKYKHQYDSCFKNNYSNKVQVISDYIDQYLNNDSKRDEIINELKDLSSNNFWIEYFFSNDIVKEYKDKGWIDFELEISKFIQTMSRLKKESNKYNKEDLSELKPLDYVTNDVNEILIKLYEDNFITLTVYKFEDTITRLEDDLNDLIRCLEIYLTCIVEKIQINIKPRSMQFTCDKVLSFNYTNTYKRMYDDDERNIEYNYIHGKADINRDSSINNMVLGIDEFLNETERNIDVDFIRFKKYFQRVHKETGSKYRKWLRREIFNDNHSINIKIFGHSLDVTDKDIIKELIENEFTRVTIYYYDKNVHAKQISNLVKIIGSKKLIEYTDELNKKITFVKINESVNVQ
ncbi:AbiH family protein [Clostridium botulinum]|uniref:AbiH family protein n=1 Tax=Clostridium botulinum TaxID=1491 RepID=UPI00069E5FB5|nr:AbiH family protein [Clostridium botulinum]